jgi:hypothetical protein
MKWNFVYMFIYLGQLQKGCSENIDDLIHVFFRKNWITPLYSSDRMEILKSKFESVPTRIKWGSLQSI